MNKQLTRLAAALGIYLVASVLLLLVPLQFDFSHQLIAGDFTDPSIFLWSLAWWPWAIGHGLNPLYSYVIWSPVGQNLMWGVTIPSISLMFAPVTGAFGPLVSYNLIAVLAPALNAVAAYLLAREVTGKFWPAVFGGWVFGFSSYEFVHLQALMQLYVTLALPLAVWFYLRRLHEKLSRRWYIALIALLAVFQFGVSTEIMASAVPLGLLAAVAAAMLSPPPTEPRLEAEHRRRQYQCLGETIIGLTVAGILLLPCFYYAFGVDYPRGIFSDTTFYSIEPLNFLVPTVTTWLGGQWMAPLSAHFTGAVFEDGAYLGLPLVGILLLFIREFGGRRNARVAIFLLAALVLAGLGEQLQVLQCRAPFTLPWFLAAHLPLFLKIQPARMAVYVWLAVAVIGAWWMAESKTGQPWKLLLAVLTIIFLLPNIPSHRWVHRLNNPPFFTTHLVTRYLPSGARVVVLPYGSQGYSMFWQAETHFYFSMAGGYISLIVPPRFAALPGADTLGGGSAGTDSTELRQFIQRYHIQAFIVVAPHPTAWLTPLHVKPIHVGGVWLYLLDHLTNVSASNRQGRK